MLLLDPREREEYSLAQYIPLAQVTTLEFGDAALLGHGDLLIGVERKRIGDLLRVIADGRFVSEQLPGLVNTYSRVYLLVEGEWTTRGDGALLIKGARGQWEQPTWGRQDGWRYAEVTRWLISLEEGAGVRVARTNSPLESAAWLENLEAEFLKAPEKRHALQGIYYAPIPTLLTPSLVRRFAALLPGIGPGKSLAVAEHFKSVFDAVNAPMKSWLEIPGVGGTIAKKVWDAVRG
jgi:ERCC4-type nuclease